MPPSHLRARNNPDLATRKRPLPTPHPRRERLRALTACGGRRFLGRFGRSRSTMLKGHRVLRSTAPRKQPKTSEISPKSEFSTPWKKSLKVFPLCGKLAKSFSIPWKYRPNIFHSVENSPKTFPYRGKLGGCRVVSNAYTLARRPMFVLRNPNSPLGSQNAFSAAPIFSLASRPGFCDKFGSSEMILFGHCSFHFAF